jgi:hypothetical protein
MDTQKKLTIKPLDGRYHKQAYQLCWVAYAASKSFGAVLATTASRTVALMYEYIFETK